MGLNYDDGGTDYLDLGNLAGATFERANVWTTGCFFRVENTAGDNRTLISKWNSTPSNSRQFDLRVDQQTAPSNIDVLNNGSTAMTSSDNIQLNTWYLVVLSCDGTVAANDLSLSLVKLSDLTFHDDQTAGTHGGDAGSQVGSIRIGYLDGFGQEFDGDMAWQFYWDGFEMTKQDILSFITNPVRFAAYARTRGTSRFFIKSGLAGNDAIDWSGNGATITINSTPTKSADPPVGAFLAYTRAQNVLAAAAAPPAAGQPAVKRGAFIPGMMRTVPSIGQRQV